MSEVVKTYCCPICKKIAPQENINRFVPSVVPILIWAIGSTRVIVFRCRKWTKKITKNWKKSWKNSIRKNKQQTAAKINSAAGFFYFKSFSMYPSKEDNRCRPVAVWFAASISLPSCGLLFSNIEKRRAFSISVAPIFSAGFNRMSVSGLWCLANNAAYFFLRRLNHVCQEYFGRDRNQLVFQAESFSNRWEKNFLRISCRFHKLFFH